VSAAISALTFAGVAAVMAVDHTDEQSLAPAAVPDPTTTVSAVVTRETILPSQEAIVPTQPRESSAPPKSRVAPTARVPAAPPPDPPQTRRPNHDGHAKRVIEFGVSVLDGILGHGSR
jgi:hypothetical protein